MQQETHRVQKRRPSCAKTTIPCAYSARTTAPQGENERPRKCQYGFPLAIDALWRTSGDTRKAWPKTMAKIATGALQHPARRHQRPSKIEAEAPMRAQMRPRVFKKRAKGVQETSKCFQKLAKSGPSAAKTRPRQAWEAPRPLPKTSPASSKTHIGHDRHRQPPSPGCRNDFSRFVALHACVPTH